MPLYTKCFTSSLSKGLDTAFLLTLQSPNSTPSTTLPTSPFVLVLPNISVLLPTTATPVFVSKYLGTYFFNKQQNPSMLQILLNTIHAFFANISTLPLTQN